MFGLWVGLLRAEFMVHTDVGCFFSHLPLQTFLLINLWPRVRIRVGIVKYWYREEPYHLLVLAHSSTRG